MATSAHIQVDNYGDLLRGTSQNRHANIDAEIDRIISKQTKCLKGVYQKYDRDKYLMIFERRYLSALMQSKFSFIDEVKRVDTGTNAVVPTLSVGVGVGNVPEDANRSAIAALELALGRGGDQAVIKDEAGYKFYGGGQQAIEKRTRVKARMFSHALKNLMEQCDRVIIMGHTVPDLDLSLIHILRCWTHTKTVRFLMRGTNIFLWSAIWRRLNAVGSILLSTQTVCVAMRK